MYERKTKDVHGHGPSNLNLGLFVCSFDVSRASSPFPSINYVLKKSWFASHIEQSNDYALKLMLSPKEEQQRKLLTASLKFVQLNTDKTSCRHKSRSYLVDCAGSQNTQ